jgi:hypothetical protein
VVLGLRLVRVRPEVELVGGVRVVAGDGVGVRVVAGDSVGVRVVLGDDLLPGPARRESLRAGLAALQRAYGKCSWSGESAHDG